MPKMKTKSGAAKRFKFRASGSIKRSQAFKRHILTKKTTKNTTKNTTENTSMSAKDIVLESMKITAGICIYTNNNITLEEII